MRPYGFFIRHQRYISISSQSETARSGNRNSQYLGCTAQHHPHLYNAIKRETPGDKFPRWENLEAVVKIQGKSRMFIGNFPTTTEDYNRHFCMLMGTSVAANQRGTAFISRKGSKIRSRNALALTGAAKAIQGQYLHGRNQSNVTFANIQKLLGSPDRASKRRASPISTPVSYLALLQQRLHAVVLATNLTM